MDMFPILPYRSQQIVHTYIERLIPKNVPTVLYIATQKSNAHHTKVHKLPKNNKLWRRVGHGERGCG